MVPLQCPGVHIGVPVGSAEPCPLLLQDTDILFASAGRRYTREDVAGWVRTIVLG